jgi:hypothetical protein
VRVNCKQKICSSNNDLLLFIPYFLHVEMNKWERCSIFHHGIIIFRHVVHIQEEVRGGEASSTRPDTQRPHTLRSSQLSLNNPLVFAPRFSIAIPTLWFSLPPRNLIPWGRKVCYLRAMPQYMAAWFLQFGVDLVLHLMSMSDI